MGIDLETKSSREIRYRRQKNEHDCVPTCLEMLGYNVEEIFPEKKKVLKLLEIIFPEEKEVKLGELIKMPGIKDGVEISELYKNPFFRIPNLLIVSNIFTMGTTQCRYAHCVVGYEQKIYCPNLGIFSDVDDYFQNSCRPLPIKTFEVPFAEDNESLNLIH